MVHRGDVGFDTNHVSLRHPAILHARHCGTQLRRRRPCLQFRLRQSNRPRDRPRACWLTRSLLQVLLLLYTVATTISAQYGFGQNMSDIPTLDDLANAILFEAIGQTFAVVGMAVAKWSLGLFLLRLVTQRWQKVAIWLTMLSLMGASISVCFVFWLQCTPPAYLWDRRIPGGYCSVDSTPVSLTLCSRCCLPRTSAGPALLSGPNSSLRLYRFLLRHLPLDLPLGPADEPA